MKAHYRFMHTHDTVTWFARVGVTSEPASDWTVTFGPEVDPHAVRDFGTALEDGVRAAIVAADARGGTPHALVIDEVAWTLADTSPEVAGCAAAIATWRSLGRPEAEAVVENVGGRWRVRFGRPRDRR
jgi:hypothetical protein